MKLKVSGISDVLKEIEFKKNYAFKTQQKRIINQITQDLKRETPVDTGKARDGWYSTSDSIENDVEYIDELNTGTSQQAPTHFIERTVLLRPGVTPNGIIVTKK